MADEPDEPPKAGSSLVPRNTVRLRALAALEMLWRRDGLCVHPCRTWQKQANAWSD